MIRAFLLAFALLNLFVIDAGVVIADRDLRQGRDAVCAQIDTERSARKSPQISGQYGLYISPVSSSFVMISIYLGAPPKSIQLNLYGCDANGHRYRFWKQETK